VTLSALVIALAYLGVLAYSIRRKRGLVFHLVLLFVAGGSIVVAALFGPLPLASPPSALPDGPEAVEIFKVLHANIYRAFDYESEDDVYGTLAQSVGDQLLYEVYKEVYGSLILRDQGGAMCTIDNVETLSANLADGAEGSELSFRVFCHWRVSGTVAHWGHIHRRINEYKALYTVARLQGAWKIVDVRVKEQSRIDR
jgi:hypothetical protein